MYLRPEFYVDTFSFQLFAAAFPLAPLIALLTNAIDMKVDARRLLWTNRRPVAFRAEDIGWQIFSHKVPLSTHPDVCV